jgi:lysophospholipase L1-like esterase
MNNRIRRLVVSTLCLSALLASAGCATMAGPKLAARTPPQRETLITPGKLGGAADNRRGFFDFWNEQVIREDVAVSTVFMGDSITELWDLPVYFVASDGILQNRGISGDLASAMAKRFQADVVQLLPRNVIILAGTNDVSSMLREKKDEDQIIRDVAGFNESMMDQARAAKLNVLVCSILPTNSDYGMHEQGKKIRAAINEKIKAACKDKGCIYVDYASQMSDANGDLRKDLARDGLHPHYKGYEIMARMIKEAAAAHGLRL